MAHASNQPTNMLKAGLASFHDLGIARDGLRIFQLDSGQISLGYWVHCSRIGRRGANGQPFLQSG